MDRRRPLLTLLAAAAGLLAGLAGIREFDAFHHLAMGRHLAAHGLSGPEPFLYPLGGQPALPPPHWLGALAFHAAEALGGLAGAVLLSGLAAAAAVAVLGDDALRGERSRLVRTREAVVTLPDQAGLAPAGWGAALAALLPVALAAGAWRLRAVVRPEVLGLLCFALTLHLLRHGGARRQWAIPALALLWACLHPSVAFGLAAVALAFLDALRDVVMAPRDAAGGPTRARARRLGLVLPASAALAALAPGGGLGLALGFGRAWMAGGPSDTGFEVARDRVLELQAPGPELLLAPPGLLLLLLPLGAWLARRRPRLGEGLLLLGLALASARSIRFVPWFAVAAAPILGRDLATAVRRRAAGGRALAAGAGVALATALAWGALWLPPGLSLGAAWDLYPVRAAAVLAEAWPAAPGARLWNALDTGGYLEWRLPGVPVYQDGRLAWPPGEAEAALAGPAERTTFARLDARWRFDALVTDWPEVEAAPGVGQGLDPAADRSRYALVAFDDGGLLYARRDGRLAGLLPREYREAVPAAVVPPARLLDPARREALVREYRRAVAEAPGCATCRAGLWLALAAGGDAAGAEAALPGGRLPEPSSPFGHPGLDAVAEGAAAASQALHQQGAALEAAGRRPEAAAALRAALLLAPEAPWAADARARSARLGP